MAKKSQPRTSPRTRNTPPAAAPAPASADTFSELENRMLVLAANMGRAIGTVQVTAERFVDRKALSTQLTRVRDQAAQLLEYLSSLRTATPARRTRAPRSGGTVDAPGKQHRKQPVKARGVQKSDLRVPKLRAAKTLRRVQRTSSR